MAGEGEMAGQGKLDVDWGEEVGGRRGGEAWLGRG